MVSMKVKINTNPKDSQYRIGNKKTWFDWHQLCGYLVTEEKLDPLEAEKEIDETFKRAAEKVLDNPDVYIPELSDNIKSLFYYFRWYADIDGAVSYYIKMSPDKEVYSLTRDPMKGSAAVKFSNGSTLEDLMRREYLKLARVKKVDFLFADDGTVDNSESNTKILPTIAEYWAKFIKNIWETDSDFRLENRPVELAVDPDVPSFFYFDVSIVQPGPHTIWDEWLLRVEPYARETFMAWIYSIFDPENTGRQCMWLKDNGYSGKSSMTRAFNKFMGEKSVGAISHGSISNQFGFSTIYGKRLIVYGDNKNPKLMHLEKITSLLGHDIVSIERKGMDAFPAIPYCKLLVNSNVNPEIDLSARNETSRILFFKLKDPPKHIMQKYCLFDEKGEIERYPDGTPKFIGGNLEEELYDELPQFLHTCRGVYERLCPNRKDIPMPEGMFKDLQILCASPEYTLLEQFIDEKVSIGKGLSCKKYELANAFNKFKKNKANNFDISRLFGHLSTMFNIEQSIAEDGARMVAGCKISDGQSNYSSGKKPGLGSNV